MDTPDTNNPSSTQGSEPRTSYLEEKAFKARTLLVFGTITDTLAADVARRLIALDAESAEPIDMLVSSPGGHLESGDTMHDLVRFITAPVNMIGTGWVGSAATHLYLAAPRERRFCLPNTRFLIHQPSGGAGGPVDQGPGVVEAQQVQNRRMEVVRVGRVLRGLERKLITLTVGDTRLDTGTPDPANERTTIVVTSLTTLCKWCPAELC